MERPMMQPKDLSRSGIPFEQDRTIVAVIDMSQSSWLVAAFMPGLDRHPLKKIEPDQEVLLRLFGRWPEEAIRAGRDIERVAVAFEAGPTASGWRWLLLQGIDAHGVHPTSIAVSREHRRAKTDR